MWIDYIIENNPDAVINLIVSRGYLQPEQDELFEAVSLFIQDEQDGAEALLKLHPDYDLIASREKELMQPQTITQPMVTQPVIIQETKQEPAKLFSLENSDKLFLKKVAVLAIALWGLSIIIKSINA